MPGTSPPYFVLTPPSGDTTSNRPTPVGWVVSTISTMINTSWQNVAIAGGIINNTTIGATTPSTAAFTTLSATGTASFSNISVSGGTINNVNIGGTTPSSGAFTTLSVSGQTSLGLLTATKPSNSSDNSTNVPTTSWVVNYVANVSNIISRTTVSNQNYTILGTDRYIAITAISSAITLSLPASTSYPAGALLMIADESGSASASNSITITVNGNDTINGLSSFVINTARGFIKLESNRTNGWTVLGQNIASTFSSTLPVMAGVAATGSNNSPARIDHVHATDTSRAAAGANSDITSLSKISSMNGGQLAGFRNRIINGNFQIDQRYGGSVCSSLGYCVDRWQLNASATGLFTAQQQVISGSASSTTYLKLTSSAASSIAAGTYATVIQKIEGINLYDFLFGSSAAKTFTLSFLFYSNTAGTYSVAFQNSGGNRSYVSTFTITSAQASASAYIPVSITVPGDSTGTWSTAVGTIGMSVIFGLGAGSTYQTSTINAWQAGNYFGATGSTNLIATSGAYMQISQVQLELGSQATPIEQRMFSTELTLCQRYFEKSYEVTLNPGNATTTGAGFVYQIGLVSGTNTSSVYTTYKVTKMTTPTLTTYSTVTGATGKGRDLVNNADVNTGTATSGSSGFGCYWTLSAASTTTEFSFQWTSQAEL